VAAHHHLLAELCVSARRRASNRLLYLSGPMVAALGRRPMMVIGLEVTAPLVRLSVICSIRLVLV
jgi:hypothetical protein